MDYPKGINRFPTEVHEQLKIYVYRLIDPRNGETFYVGKGKGNRVFYHINLEKEFDGDEIEDKLRRIRQIKISGFEVVHVIHRHGMDEETALHVEAALIDAYPGLTNLADGKGSGDFGTAHALEIIARYSAEEAVFHHKAIIIAHNRSDLESKTVYDAVRYAWKMKIAKAREAEIVLSSFQGIIKGVFIPHKWMQATLANFPDKKDRPNRIGFEGEEAPLEIRNQYLHKRIPDEFRKRGSANPVKYTY